MTSDLLSQAKRLYHVTGQPDATPDDWAKLRYVVGAMLKKWLKQPRSTPHHRRFMAMVKVAYENWPHNHDFQPSCAEHLRKWAEMSVGHRECVAQIDLADLPPKQVVAVVRGALKAAKAYAHPAIGGHTLYIWVARSIAYDKLPHAQAVRLYQDVEDFLRSESGIEFERMMEAA